MAKQPSRQKRPRCAAHDCERQQVGFRYAPLAIPRPGLVLTEAQNRPDVQAKQPCHQNRKDIRHGGFLSVAHYRKVFVIMAVQWVESGRSNSPFINYVERTLSAPTRRKGMRPGTRQSQRRRASQNQFAAILTAFSTNSMRDPSLRRTEGTSSQS